MMSLRIRTVRASFLGLPRFPWAQSSTLHKFSELPDRKVYSSRLTALAYFFSAKTFGSGSVSL